MEDKKKVTKYTALYMSLGMCFGMSMGLCVGMSIFDNMAMGLSVGMLFGIAIGSALGSAKDKEMSEKMMEISRIEEIPDSSDKLIYAIGKNEEEKEFRVDEKCFASEKFTVGDRVAEETDGKLVSLETK